MKASEYFGDWMDVIDTVELRRILSWVSTIDKTTLCPSSPNIFKAFRACPLKDCKVVFLGQDPQQGVATGILFGNSEDIKVKQNEIASIQTQIEFNQQVADDNSKYISKLKDLIS